ncbi:hypothetical protein MUK42_17562 [Musa troglodytarum]|uniref:Uncharacterized protein n=1 Tax=Musa troglodytarum TaxID=320322 RepID=A0A9E7H549_9LILI|nr:hypothetical protein MUK42_17562 [Musa troglodytarum]URE27768.1 hypothetical protein MUK42_17562 [Musa troglodytarum]
MLSSTLSVAALSSFRHGTEASAIKPLPFQNPRHRAFFPSLPLPRRIFLPTASASIWDALTGGGGAARDASLAVRRGMLLFRQGDVSGSLAEFDRAIELDPRQKAYSPSDLWQRGLSLYYLNRFEEGAEQFRLDVAKNPNDTEESIWCFLCEAQLYGVEDARSRMIWMRRSFKFLQHASAHMDQGFGVRLLPVA